MKYSTEFIVTVLAILVGLAIGRQLSVGLSKAGVPIASGDAGKIELGLCNSGQGGWIPC